MRSASRTRVSPGAPPPRRHCLRCLRCTGSSRGLRGAAAIAAVYEGAKRTADVVQELFLARAALFEDALHATGETAPFRIAQVLRGDDEHGQVVRPRAAAKLGEKLESAHLRHHEIEDYRIRVRAVGRGEPGAPIVGL